MTLQRDKVSVAITEELRRQAEKEGNFFSDPVERWDGGDVIQLNAVAYDGIIDLDALVAALRDKDLLRDDPPSLSSESGREQLDEAIRKAKTALVKQSHVGKAVDRLKALGIEADCWYEPASGGAGEIYASIGDDPDNCWAAYPDDDGLDRLYFELRDGVRDLHPQVYGEEFPRSIFR